MALGLPPRPVRLVTTEGRLIVIHAAGVAAFNTSGFSDYRSGNFSDTNKLAGTLVVSHTWEDMWRLYGLDQQQQQQQGRSSTDLADSKGVATNGRLHEAAGDSSSNSNSVPEIAHTAAADSIDTVLAAAAAASLLLLPLGDKGVVVFNDTPSLGGGSGENPNDVGISWMGILLLTMLSLNLILLLRQCCGRH